MPYERQWDPKVLGPCNNCTDGITWEMVDIKGMPEMRPRPCPECRNGQREVGGWVNVWVEPDPPTKK